MNMNIMIGMLKKALVQAIVRFYAFAGGCHQNSTTNEPELLCKSRGVDFAEVDAKIQVQYDLYDADNSIKGKLAHSQEEARGAGYSGHRVRMLWIGGGMHMGP
ncbi:hypothetical protein FEM48_Zijuj03G0079300 [Ziziphus jujuba var. spinosa]|uniref:Uncharacterized protein n=1 Tax=Ziziphus jujuba var. spinosa TaxID=714518 RepID=A0A978VP37_ZIZJJ|nr:hypothetical protein FEM48_Zijuj03G0079300 [Ziziphus jujuba var. spinosa]